MRRPQPEAPHGRDQGPHPNGDAPAAAEALKRFEREAMLASSLSHPHIAQVFDYFVEQDQPYLVMEFIEGPTLEELLRQRGPLPAAQAVDVLRQLALVLDVAHRQNVVHRDIKPGNIKLAQYQPDRPLLLKVLDFGIARPIGGIEDPLTVEGALIGTPEYMAPEQVNAQYGKIEGRTDLYAAGILFYRMLAGTLPFRRDRRDQNDWMRVCVQHVNDRPPPLPASVPPALRQITMRLLEKQQLDRFPDAAALLQALHGWGSAHRPPAALLGGSAVLGACLLAWLGWWLARVPATPAQSGLRGPPPPAPAALAPPPAPPGAVAANRALAVPAEGDAAAPRSSLPLSVQPPATKVQTKTRPTPASRAHASQPAAPSDPWATPEELSEKVRDACRNKDAEQARTYFLRLRSAERGNTEIICRDRRLRWEQSSLRYATVEQAITPGLEARGVG